MNRKSRVSKQAVAVCIANVSMQVKVSQNDQILIIKEY